MSRKKSIDLTNLPEVPEIPLESGNGSAVNSNKKFVLKSENNEQLVTMLASLRDREATLFENIRAHDNEHADADINHVAEMSTANNKNISEAEEECRDYIAPLVSRTQSTIIALIQTKESLQQLDNLHRVVEQLLMVQEQNYQMRKRLKTVKTLNALKEMEIQMNSDPEKFLKSSGFFEDLGSDIENEAEFEQNMQDLEAMLAASKSASNKRNSAKKQRSKSIIAEEPTSPLKENNRNYPLRRQSAISDFKPKVSKWTKVKAAFKWEKANTLHLSESKSSDSVLSPASDHYKNFLKVPSTQAACQSCSGDSLISTSSGKVLTATSGTPREISSAPSSDENDEMSKARNYGNRPPSFHDDERRSHSLDGEMTFGANSQQSEKTKSSSGGGGGGSKSAWSKVKGIVTSRNSRKSIKSTGSVSRDVSPIDINDLQSDSVSSPNQSSSSPNNFNLGVPDIDLCPTSDENENRKFDDGRPASYLRSVKQPKRSSKKSKLIPEIESLPEDEAFESSRRQLPSPLILKKDLSESDSVEGSNVTPTLRKLFNPKNLSVSDPNSPLKTQEFFSENDFSSGADNNDYSFSFSEPLSPLKRGSNNSSRSSRQQDEIMRSYQELQRKIKTEFEGKQQEWSKMRPLVVQLNNSVPPYLKEDLSLPSTPKNVIENLMLNEENLSADFKRKLEEWRMKKGQQSVRESGAKKSPTDWQLWKTGQLKFENQGLIALPDAKDLPEEFQKKLNEWKQMKAEGRSPPPYSHQTTVQEKLKRQFSKTDKSSSSNESSMKRSKTQSDAGEELPPQLKSIKSANEIVVQTSDGLMKFKGISRSFTRKLYEWEKAKGIEPESDSSTFAFLHPKYMVHESDHENCEHDDGSCMKRALSVDSIKPAPYSTQMSHQPSSLSLNDADNLKKEEVEKKASSSIEVYCGAKEEESAVAEPEAVIVEVEDEGLELTPMPSSLSSPMQIPVFKFDFAHKDLKNDADADFSKTFIDVKQLLEELKNNFSSFNDSSAISDDVIKHLNVKLKTLYDLLSQLKRLGKSAVKHDLAIAVTLSKELFEMLNEFNAASSVPSQNLFLDLSSKHIKIEECLKSVENRLESEKFQATSSIQNCEDDRGVATIKITPTFICNSIKVDDSTANNVVHLKVSSESEMPELSTEDMRSDDKSQRKVARNASSSSKRKIRMRRMGSRQNSKTESSDSDEEYAQSSEAQRKIKRKSSRATKKQLESDKSFDSFQGEEEVVYVFKIKPGETNEVITKTAEHSEQKQPSESILISPTENCVELIDVSLSSDLCQGAYTNPILKTKRKIFTPLDADSDNKNSSLCISHEVESSSGSEKNDKALQEQAGEVARAEVEVTTSEGNSHAHVHEDKSEQMKKAFTKDLSPSIRLMIEKYHQSIDQKPATNSNSSSPLWLSPVLDRRVRKQSAEYQFKIMKSNSFQEVTEEEKMEENAVESLPTVAATVAPTVEVKDHVEENIVKIALPPPTQSSTGCIPKISKPPQIQVECSTETVQKRSDLDKPRTPLSERALRIRQAKEAFFRSTVSPFKDEQANWNYRLSQISVGSTDSNSIEIENMSSSTGMLPTKDPVVKIVHEENKTSSLPRNVSSNSEFERESQKNSKFGLSTLATKLRKVKLKRGSKEVQKMNTVPVLCRQSLNLFSDTSSTSTVNESSSNPQSIRHLSKPCDENVKKSKSLGKF